MMSANSEQRKTGTINHNTLSPSSPYKPTALSFHDDTSSDHQYGNGAADEDEGIDLGSKYLSVGDSDAIRTLLANLAKPRAVLRHDDETGASFETKSTADLCAQVAELQAHLKSRDAEVQQATEIALKILKQNDTLRERIREINSKFDAQVFQLELRIKELETENSALFNTCSRMRVEKNQLNNQNQNLMDQIEALQLQIQQKQMELESENRLKNRVGSLLEEVDAYRSELVKYNPSMEDNENNTLLRPPRRLMGDLGFKMKDLKQHHALQRTVSLSDEALAAAAFVDMSSARLTFHNTATANGNGKFSYTHQPHHPEGEISDEEEEEDRDDHIRNELKLALAAKEQLLKQNISLREDIKKLQLEIAEKAQLEKQIKKLKEEAESLKVMLSESDSLLQKARQRNMQLEQQLHETETSSINALYKRSARTNSIASEDKFQLITDDAASVASNNMAVMSPTTTTTPFSATPPATPTTTTTTSTNDAPEPTSTSPALPSTPTAQPPLPTTPTILRLNVDKIIELHGRLANTTIKKLNPVYGNNLPPSELYALSNNMIENIRADALELYNNLQLDQDEGEQAQEDSSISGRLSRFTNHLRLRLLSTYTTPDSKAKINSPGAPSTNSATTTPKSNTSEGIIPGDLVFVSRKEVNKERKVLLDVLLSNTELRRIINDISAELFAQVTAKSTQLEQSLPHHRKGHH